MQYLLMGFAPGLYWLWYYYKRDKLNPESKRLVIRAYLAGIFVAFFVVLAQLPIHVSPRVSAVIFAPLFEESGKLLMTLLIIYRHKDFDEPIDGIIYAAAVALGFASIENAMYLFNAGKASSYMLSNTMLIRSLLSVPAHALFSGIWGYALGKSKCIATYSWIRVIPALLLAMLLHGLFNLFCFMNYFATFALLVLVAGMWEIANSNIRRELLGGRKK